MSIIDTSSTKGDSIEVLLRQIGATKITKVKGYLYFIKFNIEIIIFFIQVFRNTL